MSIFHHFFVMMHNYLGGQISMWYSNSNDLGHAYPSKIQLYGIELVRVIRKYSSLHTLLYAANICQHDACKTLQWGHDMQAALPSYWVIRHQYACSHSRSCCTKSVDNFKLVFNMLFYHKTDWCWFNGWVCDDKRITGPGSMWRFNFVECINVNSLRPNDAYICIGNLTIIGLDNGLWPGRRPAIIWTNAGIFLIRPLGTNFSEILMKILIFSLKKMHLKVSSAKWWPF